MQAALDRIADRIRASAGGESLRLRGGGTKDFYGGPLAGEVLELREYAGIVSYEPTELVVTARCGTPLSELEAALAERGQMIPFEPPHFGAAATVGAAPFDRHQTSPQCRHTNSPTSTSPSRPQRGHGGPGVGVLGFTSHHNCDQKRFVHGSSTASTAQNTATTIMAISQNQKKLSAALM